MYRVCLTCLVFFRPFILSPILQTSLATRGSVIRERYQSCVMGSWEIRTAVKNIVKPHRKPEDEKIQAPPPPQLSIIFSKNYQDLKAKASENCILVGSCHSCTPLTKILVVLVLFILLLLSFVSLILILFKVFSSSSRILAVKEPTSPHCETEFPWGNFDVL